MTMASFLSRHRRVLALAAASVLLHYAAIDWVAGRLGTPDAPRKEEPMKVSAQLRLALPERTQAVQRQAEARVPAQHRARPSPSAEVARPAVVEEDAVPEPVPEPAPEPPSPSVAALPAVEPQAGAASPPAPVQSPPAAAAEPAAGRRFRVNVPPSARFEMDIERTDADGKKWSGSGSMFWETDGSRYKVGLDAGISLLVARIELLTLRSEGTVDDAGIAPETTTEKRRTKSMTATHFDRDGQRITFSASTAAVPLQPGAQDKATVPFQLAAIGRGDVNQFGGDIDIQVGEDRGANVYRFVLVGEEEVDTKMGRLVTWRLARPPRPGSYNARLDIWLAPSLDWYPVRIRNTEGNGAVTTQTVTKILRPAS